MTRFCYNHISPYYRKYIAVNLNCVLRWSNKSTWSKLRQVIIVDLFFRILDFICVIHQNIYLSKLPSCYRTYPGTRGHRMVQTQLVNHEKLLKFIMNRKSFDFFFFAKKYFFLLLPTHFTLWPFASNRLEYRGGGRRVEINVFPICVECTPSLQNV